MTLPSWRPSPASWTPTSSICSAMSPTTRRGAGAWIARTSSIATRRALAPSSTNCSISMPRMAWRSLSCPTYSGVTHLRSRQRRRDRAVLWWRRCAERGRGGVARITLRGISTRRRFIAAECLKHHARKLWESFTTRFCRVPVSA
mgnify:CR=1 FL=1